MKESDHFLSRLIALESSGPDRSAGESLAREFSRLLSPVIGAAPAEALFARSFDRLGGRAPKAGGLRRLGYMAAFFLGEYDDPSMPLMAEDWREIRETLEEASGDIPLNLLTTLMGELLSRGKLDP
jgi:hypothetical protein